MGKDWYSGFTNRDVFGGNSGSSKKGATSYTEFASKANSTSHERLDKSGRAVRKLD